MEQQRAGETRSCCHSGEATKKESPRHGGRGSPMVSRCATTLSSSGTPDRSRSIPQPGEFTEFKSFFRAYQPRAKQGQAPNSACLFLSLTTNSMSRRCFAKQFRRNIRDSRFTMDFAQSADSPGRTEGHLRMTHGSICIELSKSEAAVG